MRAKFFRVMLTRRILVLLIILIQVAAIVYVLVNGSRSSQMLTTALELLSFVVSVVIITRRSKSAFKLTWIFFILLFPVFGGLFFLIFSFQSATRLYRKQLAEVEDETRPLFTLPSIIRDVTDAPDGCSEGALGSASDSASGYALGGGAVKERKTAFDEASSLMPARLNEMRYLEDFAGFPVYRHTETAFFSPGEKFFTALLPELEAAREYIYLEYFIVEEGVMWNAVLDILIRKAAEGVRVRLLYDDIGCLMLLPREYADEIKKYGIECRIFNPFRPFLTVLQNNRDHRKICVIDGRVAFTGGINLADEYINRKERFGHWKDAGVMLRGEGAWSFTLMFLQMWRVAGGKNAADGEDPVAQCPWVGSAPRPVSDGFVQPYADSPLDFDHVGEHVYMQLIHSAQHYLYIETPYLIIDDAIVSSLTLAAKSGVDVRIITPHRWDKRLVHMTTRSYYRDLIRGGVRIYEYTPGFLHSKVIVCDDEAASVGTVNFDYRSLYLHFECGVLMYGSRAVKEAKQDFLATLGICREITPEDCRSNPIRAAVEAVLRLLAPLM